MASFSFCNYPLEGDGFNENLFHYLWSKDEMDHAPRINIPDTIIYKYRQPTYWYFTAKNGKVKRKSKFNLVNNKIEEVFTKHNFGSSILAYYVSTDSNGDARTSTIEYFDHDGLIDFLYNRDKESNGILQRFIEPKGLSNSMIRAIWSPKVILLERRENIRKLIDNKYSLFERAVTYEGPEHNSRSSPVRGMILPRRIQTLCGTVVEHIAEVSFRKSNVSRMAVNLKIDPNDKVWFLWCSSLRMESEVLSTASRLRAPSKQGPVTVDAMCQVPSNIKVFLENTNSHGSCVDALSSCPSCNSSTIVDRFYEVPYKTIISHFEQVMRVLASNSGGKYVEWPPREEVLDAFGGVGFGPLKRIQESREKASAPHDVEIPPIIRFLHPHLKNTDYRRYRHDPLFQYKSISVCEACYLVFAEVATAMSCSSISTSMASSKNKIFDAYDDDWGKQYRSKKQDRKPMVRDSRYGRDTKQATKRNLPAKRRHPKRRLNPIVHSGQMPALPPRIDADSLRELRQETGVSGEPTAGNQGLPSETGHRRVVGYSQSRPSRSAGSSSDGFASSSSRASTPEHSESFQSILQKREDSFFRDLYQNPNLQYGHPLSHLVSGQQQIGQVYGTISGESMVSGGDSFNSRQVPKRVSSSKKSPYAHRTSKTTSRRISKVINEIEIAEQSKKRSSLGYSLSKGKAASLSRNDLRPSYDGAKISSKTRQVRTEAESADQHRQFLLDTLKEVRTQLETPAPFSTFRSDVDDAGSKVEGESSLLDKGDAGQMSEGITNELDAGYVGQLSEGDVGQLSQSNADVLDRPDEDDLDNLNIDQVDSANIDQVDSVNTDQVDSANADQVDSANTDQFDDHAGPLLDPPNLPSENLVEDAHAPGGRVPTEPAQVSPRATTSGRPLSSHRIAFLHTDGPRLAVVKKFEDTFTVKISDPNSVAEVLSFAKPCSELPDDLAKHHVVEWMDSI